MLIEQENIWGKYWKNKGDNQLLRIHHPSVLTTKVQPTALMRSSIATYTTFSEMS